ncbi:MAG TPA: glycosyltransferase, partial [Acidimicrobiales bacterium]|nr:glycosyltransferase [Acidimicrobiales bacterium]
TFPSTVDAIGHAVLGFVAPRNRFTTRYRRLDADASTAHDVDWISGSFFVVRRAVFEAVGGFDEAYFMYMEDVDLCWRIGNGGGRVRFDPNARVVHVQGVSTDSRPYRMIAEHHRSLLRFTWRSTPGWRRALVPVMALGIGARVFVAWAVRAFTTR